MKEEVIVNHVENWLKYKERFFVNVHGSAYSKNGTPDFLTLDKNGQLLAIEAKAPGKAPVVNQWRKAIEILKSGGRYIVAQDDFDLQLVDDFKVDVLKIGQNIGESEFDAKFLKINKTKEIVLKDII